MCLTSVAYIAWLVKGKTQDIVLKNQKLFYILYILPLLIFTDFVQKGRVLRDLGTKNPYAESITLHREAFKIINAVSRLAFP